MAEKDISLTAEQKKSIGAKIRQRRKQENYTLEELAERVHMSCEALERMENGDFELYDDFISEFLH